MQKSRQFSGLTLGNFKAYAESQYMPVRPLTLIYGPNSAGKSSLIQSLAFAHEAQFGQCKRNSSPLDVHHTQIGGSAIDLGGFRQYQHRGQSGQRICWGAELKTAALASSYLGQAWAAVETLTIKLEIGLPVDENGQPKADAIPRVEVIELFGDGAELLRMIPRDADQQNNIMRLERLTKKHPVMLRFFMEVMRKVMVRQADFSTANDAIIAALPDLEIHLENFYRMTVKLPRVDDAENGALHEEAQENIPKRVCQLLPYWFSMLLNSLTDALDAELNKLQYLGPERAFPSRHLVYNEQEQPNWQAGGGYTWEIVRNNAAVRAAINAWLGAGKLSTPYELSVRSFVAVDQDRNGFPEHYVKSREMAAGAEQAGQEIQTIKIGEPAASENITAEVKRVLNYILDSYSDGFRELVIYDKSKQFALSHRDIGVGVSQLLPVLALAYASTDKIVAIEHPELYLHPNLQAELADVFIESALGEQQNTFILETHSQPLLLRIMRRIREGKLNPSDVSVVYVDPNQPGSRLYELRLDAEGDFIDEWPHGFFEECFEEFFAGR
ncbi:MAG: AAA family ATPase [Methylomonas sp.]|jgi:hypothetical protein